MKLVVFGLSISSSWGNGHATLWRGLCRALAARGHRVVFFERDVPYYAANRDSWEVPGGELVLYREWEDALPAARAQLGSAEVGVVTSYCPDGLAASDLVLSSSAWRRVFYDLDTPVTLARLARGEDVPYIGPRGLADFDLVLSFTGGRVLDVLRERLGARRVVPLYGSVDPDVHAPAAPAERYRADLSYLGTYSDDRQAALHRLFVEPARLAPALRFVIGGAQYPAVFPWTPNIGFVRHLPPGEHPAFYSSSRATLNVTRGPMAEMGYCPSGRLFEAAACGTPVLSDEWEGLDAFFRPGEEILIARDSGDVLGALELPAEELAAVGRRARERALAEHVAEKRALELEHALEPQGPGAAGERVAGGSVTVWGVIPAAGAGSRIQPLAFSKELLPVGSRLDGAVERPRAVSEFLVERLVRAGATRLCFVISPGKSDILEYYGGRVGCADVAYVMQPRPAGLCDAIFRALPLVRPDEEVAVGLPDTVWFPEDGLARLDRGVLSFLLFPVDRPELFDAVLTDDDGRVREIRVKSQEAGSRWVWGAFRLPGSVLAELHELWLERGGADEYLGTLVNAWLARGGRATAVRAGEAYVDVGTLHGYREAIDLLRQGPPAPRVATPGPLPGGSRGVPPRWKRAEIEARVRALGPWFHNMDIGGVLTAPDHFLGDYPEVKWRRFQHAIPADLSGRSVLDVGCNGGFYSLAMKRRGAARVVGIDPDPAYLAQARFAAEASGLDVELRQLSVYEVAALRERFDVVLFMGVLYHLRHPLLALDLLHEHVANDLFVFQSLQRGSDDVLPLGEDSPFSEREAFDDPRYPRLHFVERRYAGDPTNWWIPNRACSEAMLRSAGFELLDRPEEEVYLCRRVAPGAAERGERAPTVAVPLREEAS